MTRQRIPVQELKLKVIAELDRELGARGTVLDIDIVDLQKPGAHGENWGITRVSDEGKTEALHDVLTRVVPRLQAQYEAVFS